VIPTPEQLEEISRLHEGALGTPGPRGPRETVPFAALLLAFSAHRRTLMIEVRRKQISKRIVFEHGVPVDCRSNLVHETLGRYMVVQGKLAAEDLHAYLGESASLGLPLGEVLLDHDVVTAEELFRVLQENLAKKLLDVFTWRDGDFRTQADVPHPQSPLKIRVPQLIVTGITKFAPQEEVDAGIVPLVGKKLCLNPSPPFALDEVRLSQRQSQVAVALRSGWRIDELALGSALPFEEITRLLYALAMLGLVITADQLAAMPAPSAVQPTSPATAPPDAPDLAAAHAASGAAAPEPAAAAKATGAGAPDPAAAAAKAAGAPHPAAAAVSPDAASSSSTSSEASPATTAYRNEIMQAYLSYRRLDAFDLLGADEEASPAAVESKYLDFARRFAPWTLDGPELGGMEEKARDLFLAAARAYAELLDLEQRNTLLFRRKARREERNRRAPADLPAIKTDLLDPEVQYRKGRALMDAGKLQEAALLIEFASDCDPQNGLYSAELAYCRFCLAPGQGARALKELQETLRRDPDCGLAVYYTGEIHRQMGDREDAEKMLRRAIKMMAPDRRPIEALKLLSAERRR
jgi:tetratricopeptide (TPR) repeat protein